MYIIFILCVINCWRHTVKLSPKETRKFYEQIPKDGLQLTVELNSVSTNQVSYQMIDPLKKDITPKILTKSNSLLKYSGSGVYTLSLTNTGDTDTLITVGTNVDKEFEVDEDSRHLRNIIEKLRSDLRNLKNENIKLKDLKEKNIKKMREDKKWLKALLLFPILTTIAGALNLKFQKNIFKPK